MASRGHGRMSHIPWWRRSTCRQGWRCQPPRRDADCIDEPLPNSARPAILVGRSMTVKFCVELVWTDGAENAAASIFLTADGRVILQGRAVSPQEREALALPAEGDMISVDRDLMRAIKDML